jgi:hypothetical protein
LKACLLRRHTLSRYERMEALWAVQPLGGQRPSSLLADLTQLCPAADRQSELFRFCFIHRLPREIRILLAQDQTSTLRELADQADVLMSHGGQPVAAVAAVEPAVQPVAAVAAQGRGRGRDRRRGGGRSQPANQPASQHTSQPASLLEYQDGNSLCFFHWTFGVQAKRCRAPCTWTAGN